MNIQGKIVTLRAIHEKDLIVLNKWSNDPKLWSMLGGWHFPYSLQSTEKWFNEIDNNDINNQIFAITAENDEIIGTANLIDIDWKNRNAFHGMMIGSKKNHGKPYAQDSVIALMKYAFEELGLHRLDGDMIDYNKLSIFFYTKICGWRIEGVKKDWFYRKNAFHDKIIIGITKNIYEEFIDDISYWD